MGRGIEAGARGLDEHADGPAMVTDSTQRVAASRIGGRWDEGMGWWGDERVGVVVCGEGLVVCVVKGVCGWVWGTLMRQREKLESRMFSGLRSQW